MPRRTPRPYFTADMFVASKFSTADQKADFANKLLAFIESGFEEKKFTKALYSRLSMTWGFIAHYDRSQFMSEYFTSANDKVRFLEQIVNHPCYGDPVLTFSDLEKAVKNRIRHMGFLNYYVDLAQAETEKEAVARLRATYDGSPRLSASLAPAQLQAPLLVQLQPHPAVQAEETHYLADISDEVEQVDTPQYSLFA